MIARWLCVLLLLAAASWAKSPDAELEALFKQHSAKSDFPAAEGVRKQQAALAAKEHGADHPAALRARANLAAFYVDIDQAGRAEPIVAEIVPKAADDPSVLILALRARAGIYRRSARYAEALADREQVLALRTKLLGAEHADLAADLAQVGEARQLAGDTARGLADLEKAVAVLEREPGPRHVTTLEARAAEGYAAFELGQNDRAEILAKQCLEAAVSVDEPARSTLRYRSTALLAAVAQQRRQPEKHLGLQLAALTILESAPVPNRGALAATLSNTGLAYFNLRKPQEASAYLERALAMMRELYPAGAPNVARTLITMARLQGVRDDTKGATALLDEAFAMTPSFNDRLLQAHVADMLATMKHLSGETDAAIYYGKRAVSEVQVVRKSLKARSADERKQFVQSRAYMYRQLAERLLETGRVAESQQALGLLKVEEYREFLRGAAGGAPESEELAYTGAEARAAERQAALSSQIASLGRELGELQRRARLDLTEAEKVRRAEVEASLVEAKRSYNDFLVELYREFASATPERNRELGERQIHRLTALRGTLRELGDGVVMLHYLVTEKRVAIILSTPTVQVARESVVTPMRLNRLVGDMRAALQDPTSDPRIPGRMLHEVLIAPVARDLRLAGAKVLMLSLDGALRYVPFSALYDGERYLVDTYETVLYSEAARDKLKDRPQAQWRIAGLGVTRDVGGFGALPSVREELEGIRGKVLPGEIFLDADFTAERFRTSIDKGFPLVHVASHFRFRPGTEADSFLLLGDGSRLSLQMIRERGYDFSGVDLITLSACDTATGGGTDQNGREVEGFGALVQNLGAKGVVATLWPVADQSTALFMQSLYQARQSGSGMTKSGALRQAQLALKKGARYKHPFYWAPFVLMGNWL